jgi:hypothetical protein
MEAYEVRSFRFMDLLTVEDWRMKLYGIAWQRKLPRSELLEAKRLTIEELRHAAPDNYKVGFVAAHDGQTVCVVFVDYWGNENELFHRVFLSRTGDPNALVAARDSDSSVCVWDLRL